MYVVDDYSDDENVIDIDEDYDTMFPPTKMLFFQIPTFTGLGLVRALISMNIAFSSYFL